MVLVVRCLICGRELPYSQSDPSELIQHVKTAHPLADKRSRTTHDSPKKKVEKDLRQSLDLNSEAFRKLIDKEIQTEVRWNDLFKMSRADSPNVTPRSSDSRRRSSSNDSVLVTQRLSLPTKTNSSPAKITDNKARFSELTPLKSKPPGESARIKNLGKDVKVLYEKKPGEDQKQRLSEDQQQKAGGDQPTSSGRKRSNHSARFYKTSIEKWQPVGDEKIHCPRCRSFKRPIVRTHRERTTESSFLSTIFMTCWPCCLSPCLFPEPSHENLHCPVCNYPLGVFDHVLKVVKSNPNIEEEIS